MTILYIDDEPINLLMFRKNFEKRYNVIATKSIKEGLEALASNQNIGLVVSDLRMPDMDGVEFIRQTKVIYPHLPFFILTGFELTKDIVEALEQGVITRYFRKPFELAAIEDAISEVCI